MRVFEQLEGNWVTQLYTSSYFILIALSLFPLILDKFVLVLNKEDCPETNQNKIKHFFTDLIFFSVKKHFLFQQIKHVTKDFNILRMLKHNLSSSDPNNFWKQLCGRR